MSESSDEKSKIRRYLLGTLADESEIEETDNKILLEDEFYQRFLVAEEELIQDYADGGLTVAERASFENHFLISDDRKQRLNFARALRKYVDEQPEPTTEKVSKPKERGGLKNFFGGFLSKPTPVFAVLLALFCAGAGVWYFFGRSTEIETAQALLDKAYRAERPFKPRVSQFSYAPFVNTRGAAGDAKINLNEQRQAEMMLLNEANKNPSGENLHALGRLHLVKKEFDRAIAELEKAVRANPSDAAALSDLGTARLEKANSLANADDKKLLLTTQALEDFSRALEKNPKLPEAAFNKAVALEILNLPEQARLAWSEYLSLDDKSQWAEEARKSRDALGANQPQSKTGAELLREFMAAHRVRDDDAAYRLISRNREMITNKLVAQQLVFSFLDANAEAEKAEYLEALKYAARLESEKSGDPFVADIARFYAEFPNSRLNDLRQAADDIKSGYDLSASSREELALEKFRRARRLYAEAGSETEAGLCDYWIGYCLNRVNKINDSTRLLERLAAFSRKKNYKWLDSQATNWLAFNMLADQQLSRATEYNRRSLELSEQVSDLYNTQKNLSQRASIYRYAGNYEKAVGFAQKAVAAISDAPEVGGRQKWRVYTAAADIFFGMKLYEVSSAYRKESLRIALEENNASFIFVSYLDLAVTVAERGNSEAAFDLLRESRLAAENITGEGIKKRSLADTDLQTARALRRAGNCSEALNFYDRAVSFYSQPDYRVNLYESRKGRLLCYLQTKQDAAFETELAEVLHLFRQYRAKILDEQNRNAFFDAENDVYDIAIARAAEKGDYARAFDYSEESRARSLLDLQNLQGAVTSVEAAPEIKFSPGATEPFKLAEIQAEMPENVQILQYFVLADKTLIWIVTKEKLTVAETNISARDLLEKSDNYRRAVSANASAGKETLNESASELYRLLVAPVADKLDRQKKICLIPDKSLFRLPFAALVSRGGDFLISEYDFFVAPSASIFLLDTRRAALRGESAAETLLSVGNPDFDKQKFPELLDLPSAEREATEIARFYDQPVVLTGREAGEKAIRTRVETANVFHFAGHYVVDEISPLLSGLVLASGERSATAPDELLANHEIIGAKMPAAKLIVLSACDTGGERVYRGEGMLGAARAFLAAGVPLVVASQWKVDSDATAELMIKFHGHRRAGKMPVSAALRRAQLDLLEGENQAFRNPYYWAAFNAFGGYTEF